MSGVKGLIDGAKNAVAAGMIAGTLLISPANGNYQNYQLDYRLNTPEPVVLNASPAHYIPTPADVVVDAAIRARNTLQYSEAWNTINNPNFDSALDLPWDGGYKGFVKWRDNGIQKPTAYVQRQAPVGAVIGAHEVPAEKEANKFTTEYDAVCAPKDFAVLMYKANDTKLFVERFLQSEEYRQPDSFLKGKGLEPKYDIEYYVAGFISKEAEAGVTPYDAEGIKVFAFATDIGEKLRQEAQGFNVSLRSVVVNALMHELCHIYGIKGTPEGEEKLEKLLVEFYDTQLKGHIGSTTNTGYGRDSVLLNIWKNYYEGRKISSSRKDVVRDIYTELQKSRSSRSIDEVVFALEKVGLGEKEIAEFVSRYSSETSKSVKGKSEGSKGENAKSSNYDMKTADYNANTGENENTDDSGKSEKVSDGAKTESSEGESAEGSSNGNAGGGEGRGE